ncbi:MFS transporter [Pseudonocardia xinjiangensis]|uniref:MFS transporter n=1 Tax=Pseudonocardia xinjiangensis TaxID=75289 RepID=UPI003D903F7F
MPNPASSEHLEQLRDRAGHELASALDRIPFRRAHVLILVLVAAGTLVNAIEEYDVGLAAPLIARQWSLSNAQVGLLTTVTFAGMAIGSLIAGVTGDRYGRRITMMYTLALYTVGALAAAFSPSFVWLLVARFVVGIGLGGELSTGITLVAELMPTKFRGAAVATVNVAGGGLGIFASSALGALMLGPLETALGGPTVAWRWLFGVLAIPALLVFAYRWFLPESPRYLLVDGRVDEANTVLTRLAANRLRRRPGMPTTRYIDAVEGARLPRQRVRLAEVFRGRLARNTVVLWVVSAMTFGAQVTVTVFMPTVLVARGLDVSTSLVYTMIINVGGLVGAVLASIFGYWFKRRVVLGYGSVVAVVVAVAFALSPVVLVLGALLQLMFILLNTTTFVWATELYPTRVRAIGTGAMVTVLLLSASLVPLLAGLIVDATGTVGLFVLVGVMYVIMAVAVWFGPETHGLALEE